MIRACQEQAEFSLHLLEEIPEALRWVRRNESQLAWVDPLPIGSTRQRDQTSICGNSEKPSTKIEFE